MMLRFVYGVRLMLQCLPNYATLVRRRSGRIQTQRLAVATTPKASSLRDTSGMLQALGPRGGQPGSESISLSHRPLGRIVLV